MKIYYVMREYPWKDSQGRAILCHDGVYKTLKGATKKIEERRKTNKTCKYFISELDQENKTIKKIDL